MTQEALEDKLIELTEKQPEIEKNIMLFESEYIYEYSKLLLGAQGMYPSQPSRTAHADREIRQLPIWEKYQTALYEKRLLDYDTKVYMTIAKLRISGNYK